MAVNCCHFLAAGIRGHGGPRKKMDADHLPSHHIDLTLSRSAITKTIHSFLSPNPELSLDKNWGSETGYCTRLPLFSSELLHFHVIPTPAPARRACLFNSQRIGGVGTVAMSPMVRLWLRHRFV